MKELVVIGQGYVGLPMALRASEVGFRVTGLDLNESTVQALNAGKSHIDDISDQALAKGLSSGYRATTDEACIADADVVVVCVPTPLSVDGGPDLKSVEATARSIGRHVSDGTLCILESTTYPGTTEEVFAPLITRGSMVVGVDIFIAFSPERIDPGNSTYGIKNTPKVVGGMTPACTEKASSFYSAFVDRVVPTSGCREAEMAKLLENTFRHVNIALVNEMVRFSNELEIDIWEAISAASTKPFGFMPFWPGPGVGGHCIPIDPSYLSHRVKAKLGYAFRMVELAEEINHAAPNYVADRCRDLLNERRLPVKGSEICLIGVSYKANIADQRESPAIPLSKRLTEWGASLSYHDPLVHHWAPFGRKIRRIEELGAEKPADLYILLQNHESVDLRLLESIGSPILDTRAALPASDLVHRL